MFNFQRSPAWLGSVAPPGLPRSTRRVRVRRPSAPNRSIALSPSCPRSVEHNSSHASVRIGKRRNWACFSLARSAPNSFAAAAVFPNSASANAAYSISINVKFPYPSRSKPKSSRSGAIALSTLPSNSCKTTIREAPVNGDGRIAAKLAVHHPLDLVQCRLLISRYVFDLGSADVIVPYDHVVVSELESRRFGVRKIGPRFIQVSLHEADERSRQEIAAVRARAFHPASDEQFVATRRGKLGLGQEAVGCLRLGDDVVHFGERDLIAGLFAQEDRAVDQPRGRRPRPARG